MLAEFAVALLRGINVGGKNKLPMTPLAKIFVAAGCSDVRPYIQSGNIVFRPGSDPELARFIRTEILSQFGLIVPVTLRTASEIEQVVSANSFLKAGADEASLHVMFLEHEPSAAQIAALDQDRSRPDEFVVAGRHIYLRLPNGAAKTRLTNSYFDSRLKTIGTQRNWRTVLALAEMMQHHRG